MALAGSGNRQTPVGELVMKRIAAIFALAFALTSGMAHIDQAMADSAGTVIVYPEQASQCDGTAC
jgi:hypothetical protein